MALTIGELVGFIRFDPSGVDDGANRAEGRMRQLGDDMGDTANRAGQTAGQNLGDGLVRGADGRLRNASGQFVAAGRRIGESTGEGVTDGASDGAQGASSAITDALNGVKGMVIGGAIGAALMAGMAQALEQGQITGRLGAQLGKTPAEAQKYGKIAGELYANAVTTDFQGAADAIRATMSAGLLPPNATNAQIQSISTKVADLANTFELDLGQSANAVGQIMKTGLAPNAQTALDVMTRGLQVMGPRADDIADTFNEYSTIFRQMGISAADATGIMSQGLKAGARDTDVVADSLKEFVLITQGGGKEVDAAFKTIGLSGKEMQTAFTKGGPEAKAALDKVFDGLRQIKDPADRSALALTLFGTKSEDMQKALFAIDPSKAVDALGKTAGAADKMGNTLRDNAGTRVEQFKRSLQQGLVNVMGSQVIPALMKVPGYVRQVGAAFQQVGSFIANNKTAFITIASVITTLMIPSLVRWATTAATTAAANVTAWATSTAAAVTGAARQVAANALTIASWVKAGAMATATAARVVAGWVLMGVQSMLRAAQMAAAWLVAMGPVGWIIAAVVALVALIIANWDTVKSWTLAIWDWVWNKIKSVAQFMINLFMNFTLIGLIIKHWDTIKKATAAAWDWVWNKIKAIGAFIVNLFMNFTVPGLIIKHWDTIKKATGAAWDWVKSKVMAVVNGVKSFISSAFNAIYGVVSSIWNKAKSITSSVWGAIRSTISSMINSAKSIASSAVNSIVGFFSSGFNRVKSAVSNAISGVISTIRGLASRVKGAVSGAASWLYNAGKSIIQGLINGIKNMAGNVTSAVKGVLSKARDLLPFSPAKKGPFSGKGWTLFSGRSIMEALAKGIRQRSSKVADATKSAMVAAQRHKLVAQTPSLGTATAPTAPGYISSEAGMGTGMASGGFRIENYYEAERGSARDTATELEWLAKTRG